MFTFGITSPGPGFDPLILLLIALALEALIGRLAWLGKRPLHPVVFLGRLCGWLDKKLNREHRSQMDRAVRGAVTVLIVVSFAGAIGWGGMWLTFHHELGWAVEVVLLMTLLAGRDLFERVRDVQRPLGKGDVEAARDAVSHVVGRDPAYLDDHGVARAAIESLAENFSDAVVAPVFWYVLFGLPGIMIYKAVNTMDSLIGYRNERYRAFGMTAARLDDILNIVPARLSGLMITLAAAVSPKANPWGAFKTMLRDAGKHRSVNAGWPEGAMAGALGLMLAGPRKYAKETVNDAWIGTGRAMATAMDIKLALYIYVAASLVNVLVVAVVAMFRFSL